MAATEVIALVMDAMAKIESGLTSTPDAESRLPKAPLYRMLSVEATMAVTQGICLRWMPSLSTLSIAPVEADLPKSRGVAWVATSRLPPNCRRVSLIMTLLG